MRKVVILDQFVGPSPYNLQQYPMSFEDLTTKVLSKPERYTMPMGRPPLVTQVDEDFRPTWCTTVYAADEHGNAFAWKYNWDSSG